MGNGWTVKSVGKESFSLQPVGPGFPEAVMAATVSGSLGDMEISSISGDSVPTITIQCREGATPYVGGCFTGKVAPFCDDPNNVLEGTITENGKTREVVMTREQETAWADASREALAAASFGFRA